MPIFIAALWGGLIQVCGTLVGRIIVALGISLVTFGGIDTSLTWMKSQITNSFNGLPSQAVGVLSAAGVGAAVAIVISAIAARLALDALTDGKKVVFK
jgi:ABC-type Co2+ transport system permease subunit